METKFNFDGQYLYLPTVFRPDFNNFARLSSTQAWSMFFTASREDTALGFSREPGRFWNAAIVAIVISGILGVMVFQSF